MLFRHLRGRLREHGRFGVHIGAVWDTWIGSAELPEEERLKRDALLRQLDAETLAAIRADLVRLETEELSAGQPLVALRRELMASVDRRMLNLEILNLPEKVKSRLRATSSEVLQTDAQAVRYLAANELRMAVLREYAALRFGDRNPDDWFAVYEQASRYKQRSARAFFERCLAGETDFSLDDARHQAITAVDDQLRRRLLQVPPGTVFPGLARRQTPGSREE